MIVQTITEIIIGSVSFLLGNYIFFFLIIRREKRMKRKEFNKAFDSVCVALSLGDIDLMEDMYDRISGLSFDQYTDSTCSMLRNQIDMFKNIKK